ncbi:hypothetical protein BGZ74_011704 [Mortierella antarctica]|nr:hypothetical protein BGZ74_011704 [Mortierella antarctica]
MVMTFGEEDLSWGYTTTDGNETQIEHLGIQVLIREGTGTYRVQEYTASADFQVQVLLPKSYSQYGQIHVDGVAISVYYDDLDDIRFGNAFFSIHNGDVIGTGVLHTKAFKATAKVGDIEADYILSRTVCLAATSSPDYILTSASTKPTDLEVCTNFRGSRMDAQVELASKTQTWRMESA